MPRSLDVEIGDVTPANLQQFRLINTTTLPVTYSNKFYNELLSKINSQYLKFAIFNGITIGTVCARIEKVDDSDSKKLYLMILNVLPSYQRLGVASKLIDHVLSTAAKDPTVTEAYLHVQVSNADALGFYLSQGFVECETIENYYKNIEPPHARLLRFEMKDYRKKNDLK